MVLAAGFAFAYVALQPGSKRHAGGEAQLSYPFVGTRLLSTARPARFENEPGEQEAAGEDVRQMRQAADASGPRPP